MKVHYCRTLLKTLLLFNTNGNHTRWLIGRMYTIGGCGFESELNFSIDLLSISLIIGDTLHTNNWKMEYPVSGKC